MKHTAYILTGSNVGDPLARLQDAIKYISEKAGDIVQQSAVYRTAAWGNTEQPPFLNQVLRIETALFPEQLMMTLLQIEAAMGRVREQKWEPRIIDLDILFYDDIVIRGNLNIPHPLLHERRFTMVPLKEIAPLLVHPALHRTVSELLDACPDDGIVEKL